MSSVFKSMWPVAMEEWHDPCTVVPMDICGAVKDTLNAAVAPVNSINFDVVLCMGENLFKEVKVSAVTS